MAIYPDKAAEMGYLLAHALGNADDAEFADKTRAFLDWLECQQ